MAARPKGACRMIRRGVAAFAKGIALACKPRLDPNHSAGSECDFICERLGTMRGIYSFAFMKTV